MEAEFGEEYINYKKRVFRYPGRKTAAVLKPQLFFNLLQNMPECV